jgi:hypothetical protein
MDFKSQPNVILFINDRDFRFWLITKSTRLNLSVIRSTINLSYVLSTEPYLYKAPNNTIYLIQNVITGDRNKAIDIAEEWRVNKRNRGYYIVASSGIERPYRLYGISLADTISLQEDHTNGSPDYVEILTYNDNNQFAAMLRMT